MEARLHKLGSSPHLLIILDFKLGKLRHHGHGVVLPSKNVLRVNIPRFCDDTLKQQVDRFFRGNENTKSTKTRHKSHIDKIILLILAVSAWWDLVRRENWSLSLHRNMIGK